MRLPVFFLIAIAIGAAVFGVSLYIGNDYVFFAGYTVLQFIVLATAWNILGGYCGYVNFGSAAFFALGAYTTVALHKFDPTRPIEIWLGIVIPFTKVFFGRWFELNLQFLAPLFPLPIAVLILVGGIVSGVVGLGVGYLTLRLRGVFFAIATLALAIVLQTFIVNWTYVGGSRGAYIIRPNTISFLDIQFTYIQYLYLIMLVLAVISVTVARLIERSRLGYGFATIRDDELAAEASGVPTLRLKLIATTISGTLMGMSGAPFPYYIGYLEPTSAFGLAYAVNSIAMPMIGGTSTWLGPVIGAILLGTLQQVATVTISSAVNLLIVGLLLVNFVIIAPNGIVGLIRDRRTASSIDQPTVFVLLYVLNLLPMYFLAGQGGGAQLIGLVFWAVLVFLAYTRGGQIGRRWLIAFPLIGIVLSLLPIMIAISPNVAIAMLAVSTIAQIVGIVCGVVATPRVSEATVR